MLDVNQPSPDAVDALIALSADPDSEARDWARFGLGTQFADENTDAIRATEQVRGPGWLLRRG